jgi:hypothetical protein
MTDGVFVVLSGEAFVGEFGEFEIEHRRPENFGVRV